MPFTVHGQAKRLHFIGNSILFSVRLCAHVAISCRTVNDDFEESKAAYQQYFLDPTAQKPWILTKAIMVPNPAAEGGEEAVGFVFTARPSPWGLKLAYYLCDDCWGKGYASAGAKKFLEEYWSEPRRAPLHEIYRDVDEDGNLVEVEVANKDEQLVEIKHLIAEVDYGNIGSMRVAEKCGGNIIDSFDDRLTRFEGLRKHAVWKIEKPS